MKISDVFTLETPIIILKDDQLLYKGTFCSCPDKLKKEAFSAITFKDGYIVVKCKL